jgi:hypothetical protein
VPTADRVGAFPALPPDPNTGELKMKVFVTSGAAGRVDVVLDVRKPNLPDFLKADRKAARKTMNDTFAEMFKSSRLDVRFEDECPACRSVMETSEVRPGHYVCTAPVCEDGRPPVGVLHLLMCENPALPDETAHDWYARLRAAWKAKYKL